MGKREASMYIWNGWTLFIGVIPDNQEHVHHLIQISIGLIRDFTLSHGSGIYECRYAMVAPDEPHCVDDHQEWQVLIYVDPETVVGRQIKSNYFQNKKVEIFEFKAIEPFIEELRNIRDRTHTCREARMLVDRILGSLTANAENQNNIDPRIQKAVNLLKQIPLKKISVRELAVAVGLSESRLTHLFRQHVGIPIRRYLMWLRLFDAFDLIFRGVSFTEAAHHAGFADHAHLSRTFRTMYGMRLNDFVKIKQSIRTLFCSEW
jgi:AraC-like DNA-binding protein